VVVMREYRLTVPGARHFQYTRQQVPQLYIRSNHTLQKVYNIVPVLVVARMCSVGSVGSGRVSSVVGVCSVVTSGAGNGVYVHFSG